MSIKEYKGWNRQQKIWYVLYLMLAAKLPESRRMKIAKTLRLFFAKRICFNVSEKANIEKNAHFNPGVSIDEYSSIGVDCEIDGPCHIGKYVMMGPETIIYSRNHKHERTDIPMQKQGYEEYKPVFIEDDVWIGRRVMIMPGVTIREGCILAAGCVVTSDTEPYCVYGGVPAKKIREREKGNCEECIYY